MRTVTTLALLSLLGSCAEENRQETAVSQRRSKARNIALRISFATVKSEPGFVAMVDRDRGTVHVDPRAILTERDVVSTKVTEWEGRISVVLELTSEGAVIMDDFTSKHIGQLVAVIVDGELISVPKIVSTAGGKAWITGAPTREWAEDVARRLEGR